MRLSLVYKGLHKIFERGEGIVFIGKYFHVNELQNW